MMMLMTRENNPQEIWQSQIIAVNLQAANKNYSL